MRLFCIGAVADCSIAAGKGRIYKIGTICKKSTARSENFQTVPCFLARKSSAGNRIPSG